MTQTGTMTKLQNKRHENINIKQNPKPHITQFQLKSQILSCSVLKRKDKIKAKLHVLMQDMWAP